MLAADEELPVDVLWPEAPLVLLLLLLPQAAITTAKAQTAAEVSKNRFAVIVSLRSPARQQRAIARLRSVVVALPEDRELDAAGQIPKV